MRRFGGVVAVTLTACAPPVAPSGPVSGTGYVDLVLDVAARGIVAEEVVGVTVGGIEAYDLRADDGLLTVTVQGGPPGEAEVVVSTAKETWSVGALVYEGPVDPLFDRYVAFGASLTQGTRDAVPSASAQLAGPAMAIARSAGAWLSLPMLADPLVPMGPSDVGEDCSTPGTVSFIVQGLVGTLELLRDPKSGLTDLARARVTPELRPHNVAVGNATLVFQRIAYDGRAEDVVAQMVARLSIEASGSDLFAPLDQTPLERVLELDPTLLVSFDLWGNDAIYALFGGKGPEEMTPVAVLAAELEAQLDVLEASGAEVVLAALPDVTLLPGINLDPAELGVVTERVAAYNAAARRLAATRPWLHIAPLDEVVADVAVNGFPVGDEVLTTKALGGLLSLDGLHFTDTGYAMAANVVLATIREELGVEVPDVDVEAVLATDARSPKALLAAGVPEHCFVR